ncbi:50S ribosomal protein L32 [Malacoplasma penetrans]|uniref:50S ribosomal protein L32 n=1 Tax=Malacoplasma penetrans TaxID=28227 RepID=UPI001011586D|nr:50S ribosomal protein L32 [Malacoplasma penetrans]RXY97124.1 50S ribosomal protein L32 [Malacoplasma penetrans]
MAVPQRKVTHSRKAKRGSHLHLSIPTLVACKRCGKKITPHRVCNSCGYYKNKKVLQIEA